MTARSRTTAAAEGQIAVAVPGRSCVRCWLITDAVLAHERKHRPPGYDQNRDAPGDPQVVSMSGTLASEACNCVLDPITGYSDGRRAGRFWQYDGRDGTLESPRDPVTESGLPGVRRGRPGRPGPDTLKRPE